MEERYKAGYEPASKLVTTMKIRLNNQNPGLPHSMIILLSARALNHGRETRTIPMAKTKDKTTTKKDSLKN